MADTQISDQATSRNQSAVRAVLRNELTWILFILGAGWGIVVGVVLPIQKLQLQTDDIQVEIAGIKNSEANIPQIEQDHAVIKQELGQLQTELENHINQTK